LRAKGAILGTGAGFGVDYGAEADGVSIEMTADRFRNIEQAPQRFAGQRQHRQGVSRPDAFSRQRLRADYSSGIKARAKRYG